MTNRTETSCHQPAEGRWLPSASRDKSIRAPPPPCMATPSSTPSKVVSEGRETERSPQMFVGPELSVAYLTSTHIPLARTQSQGPPNLLILPPDIWTFSFLSTLTDTGLFQILCIFHLYNKSKSLRGRFTSSLFSPVPEHTSLTLQPTLTFTDLISFPWLKTICVSGG